MIRTVKKKYKERENEVKIYLDLVMAFDEIDVFSHPEVKCIDMEASDMSITLNVEIIQIFRATFYLVLYNLIESTINDIIREYKETVSSEKLTIDKLSPQARAIYIDGIIGNKSSEDSLSKIIENIVKNVIDGKNVAIERTKFNVSGNVNYEFFNQVMSSLGCGGKISVNKEDIANCMEKVKNYRNNLAHGNISFVSVGRAQTVTDMKKEYDLITTYLQEVIEGLITHLDKKKYKR